MLLSMNLRVSSNPRGQQQTDHILQLIPTVSSDNACEDLAHSQSHFQGITQIETADIEGCNPSNGTLIKRYMLASAKSNSMDVFWSLTDRATVSPTLRIGERNCVNPKETHKASSATC